MWRSAGYAFNEVVIALLDKTNNLAALRRFAIILFAATTLGLGLTALTPFSDFWFRTATGLPPDLVDIARTGLIIGLLWPALEISRNYFQGILVQAKRTRPIPEGVAIFLIVAFLILWAGIRSAAYEGIYVTIGAFIVGLMAQNIWMWIRSRPERSARYLESQVIPFDVAASPAAD